MSWRSAAGPAPGIKSPADAVYQVMRRPVRLGSEHLLSVCACLQ